MKASEVLEANHCWPWSHKWWRWEDQYLVEKRTTMANTLVRTGVEQHRRCKTCGKLQIRIEWNK